jgi:hypothetical protein
MAQAGRRQTEHGTASLKIFDRELSPNETRSLTSRKQQQ